QAYVAGKFELRPKGQPRRVGHIMQSFVKPGLRGRGVGTALVTALLDWFRKRRVEDVSLRYVVGNRRAEQFWKGLGFRPLIVTANARPEVIGRRLARFRARLSRAR
ncbi:MAG TPA: GNAT family N-acetyltransferase, partial [Planctomycetota bacterium]